MTNSSARSVTPEKINNGNLIEERHLVFGNLSVKAEIPNSSTCISVQFNPDGKTYGVALAEGLANAFLTRTDRLIYVMNKKESPRHCSATSIRFRPWGNENLNQNSLAIVTFTNGKVKTFHFPTGECIHSVREGREVITSAYGPRGDTFATAGADGKLNVYDDETRVKLVSYEPPFYEKENFRRIYSIVYHPQATDELITGGWDGIVRYYDIRIPHIIKQFYGPYICGEGLAFDPTGKEICSASWRRGDALQLWDYGSGALMKTIPVEFDSICGKDSTTTGWSIGSFRPRTSVISLPPVVGSSFSSDSKMKLLLPKMPSKPTKLPKLLYSCRYFMNENFIAFCGAHDNSVAVINKHTNEVLTAICGLSNSVYCLDTHRSKIALGAGNFVAVVKLDKRLIHKIF